MAILAPCPNSYCKKVPIFLLTLPVLCTSNMTKSFKFAHFHLKYIGFYRNIKTH